MKDKDNLIVTWETCLHFTNVFIHSFRSPWPRQDRVGTCQCIVDLITQIVPRTRHSPYLCLDSGTSSKMILQLSRIKLTTVSSSLFVGHLQTYSSDSLPCHAPSRFWLPNLIRKLIRTFFFPLRTGTSRIFLHGSSLLFPISLILTPK